VPKVSRAHSIILGAAILLVACTADFPKIVIGPGSKPGSVQISQEGSDPTDADAPASASATATGTRLVRSIDVRPATQSVSVGDAFRFTATVTLLSGATNSQVRWSSLNPAVMTVNATTGDAVALTTGNATVIAYYPQDPSFKGASQINVVQPRNTAGGTVIYTPPLVVYQPTPYPTPTPLPQPINIGGGGGAPTPSPSQVPSAMPSGTASSTPAPTPTPAPSVNSASGTQPTTTITPGRWVFSGEGNRYYGPTQLPGGWKFWRLRFTGNGADNRLFFQRLDGLTPVEQFNLYASAAAHYQQFTSGPYLLQFPDVGTWELTISDAAF
jgi:hypothetical protein